MAISETKGQKTGVESYPHSVKEGQRYINLNPGRLFVQQSPKKGKGSRGSLYSLFPFLLTWPNAWLIPDWHCVLCQPVASQVYLLWLTLERQTALMLLDQQGACNGLSLEDIVDPSFFCPGLSPCSSCP